MTYTSLEQLPLALSAEDVAQVLGISRANAYTLMHSKGFPTIKIGKRMTVPMIALAVGVVLCGVLAQPLTNVIAAAAAAIL